MSLNVCMADAANREAGESEGFETPRETRTSGRYEEKDQMTGNEKRQIRDGITWKILNSLISI